MSLFCKNKYIKNSACITFFLLLADVLNTGKMMALHTTNILLLTFLKCVFILTSYMLFVNTACSSPETLAALLALLNRLVIGDVLKTICRLKQQAGFSWFRELNQVHFVLFRGAVSLFGHVSCTVIMLS